MIGEKKMMQNISINTLVYSTVQGGTTKSITPNRLLFADFYSKAVNAACERKRAEGKSTLWNHMLISDNPTHIITLPSEYQEMYDRILAIDGRKEAAMEVVISQIRAAQYFDYGDVNGKLAQLKNNAENADYSGMSAAEKAKVIYDRWDQAFGDFRKIYAEGYLGYPGRQTDAERILLQFNNELRSVFGSTENARAEYRIAEYGNKSPEDIRAEITARYPQMSEITLREFHFMVYEMYQVAADDGLWKVLNRSNCPSLGVTAGVKEALFDKPLNVSWLSHTYNTMQNAACKSTYNDVGNSGTVLHELFGASFDGQRNIYSNSQQILVGFRALIKQLTDILNTMSTSDYEEWLAEQYKNFIKGN